MSRKHDTDHRPEQADERWRHDHSRYDWRSQRKAHVRGDPRARRAPVLPHSRAVYRPSRNTGKRAG